jgi:formiminotetrahydrofolate cyclodeaminase
MGESLGAVTFDQLLDQLAAPAPAPAGASAAALTAAMAASLVVMVARGTPAWPEGTTVTRRASVLRTSLLELADDDARAVGLLLAATRAPKTTHQAEEFARTLEEASKPPLAIAVAAAEIAELAAEAEKHGKPVMRADAAVAAAIARAATNSAVLVIEANLNSGPGNATTAEGSDLLRRAREATLRAKASATTDEP